jgi:hypothetical protein
MLSFSWYQLCISGLHRSSHVLYLVKYTFAVCTIEHIFSLSTDIDAWRTWNINKKTQMKYFCKCRVCRLLMFLVLCCGGGSGFLNGRKFDFFFNRLSANWIIKKPVPEYLECIDQKRLFHLWIIGKIEQCYGIIMGQHDESNMFKQYIIYINNGSFCVWLVPINKNPRIHAMVLGCKNILLILIY